MVATPHTAMPATADRQILLSLGPDPEPAAEIVFGPLLRGRAFLIMDNAAGEGNLQGPVRIRRCNGQWVVAVCGELKAALDQYEQREIAALKVAGLPFEERG